MVRQTTALNDQHTAPARTQTFLLACERVLATARQGIDTEQKRSAAFLPMPDCFLFGAQTIESDIYPLICEAAVTLAQPPGSDRAIVLSNLFERILRLAVYHQALQNIVIDIATYNNDTAQLAQTKTEEPFTAR